MNNTRTEPATVWSVIFARQDGSLGHLYGRFLREEPGVPSYRIYKRLEDSKEVGIAEENVVSVVASYLNRIVSDSGNDPHAVRAEGSAGQVKEVRQ